MIATLKSWAKRVLPEPLLIHASAFDHWLNGEAELRLVAVICPKDRLAVDVGANIGTYSYFMRRHARGVVAYEANPGLAERLARVFPDIRVRHVAVSDRHGDILTLRTPVENGRLMHELASVQLHFDAAPNVVAVEVRCVALDQEDLSDVGFIKIDVEQHELAVLRGAMKLIRRDRPNLMVEVSPLKYDRPLPEVFDFLRAEGYQGLFKFDGKYHLFDAFDPGIHAREDQWPRRFMNNNVLFFPDETPTIKALTGS
jgi:FkbM family methyltransferase